MTLYDLSEHAGGWEAMREAEFVNDLRCNYLTIPYEGEENNFALRMLLENMTDSFLPVELRRLDGQTFLYYNISGMQSMEVIYAEKMIDKKAFQTFMWHLHDVIELSRELFLSGNGICLEPSVVFWDLGKQRWEFVYIPKQDERDMTDIQKEREQLAEFLVMRTDYADSKLMETVYRFYEEIYAGRMYTDSFLEKEEIREEKIWEIKQEVKQEQEIREDMDIEDWEEETERGERDDSPQIGKKSKNRGIFLILLFLWCLSIVATFLGSRIVPDIILPGAGVSVILAALLLYIKIKSKHIRHKINPVEPNITYMEEENVFYEQEHSKEEQSAEEKTVYMDIKQEQERKLYGIGTFRQQKIFLDGLPCVVGKDKTLADHIISDTSISRMHARFFTKGEELWMQDLNSTNGTYHNGLRLRPNEKVMLEPEDEIGFGRVQFVFR